MRSTIMDHTVGTLAGFIVEPIDVLTTGIRIPMEDIILTPTGAIIVRPISGDGVISNAILRMIYRNLQSTARYTALAPDRFVTFWRD